MKTQLMDFQVDFLNRIKTNKSATLNVLAHFLENGSTPHIITKYNDNQWIVLDSNIYKYFYKSDHTYHCFFSKKTGFTCRISDNINNPDPKYCELGPEILDLEISVNGCPKVGGKNCKFCYKNNSDKEPTNMSYDTFVKIVSTIPKCLYSIAFGITGVKTNPDFPKMLRWCTEHDIVPNYTLSGADLDDEMTEITTKYCGAVAVSCYQGCKDLCYNTIKKFHDSRNDMHVNMHIVLSEDPEQLNHVWDVLKDIKDKKVIGLRNIVFLRIKPVGRAKNLNYQIHFETYEKIMKYCMDNNIGFGFDSCSAKTSIKVLEKMGKHDLIQCCEPCESDCFSSYISCEGLYHHCSFCEHDPRITPVNVLQYDDFQKVWNHPEIIRFRNIRTDRSCKMFNLDADS